MHSSRSSAAYWPAGPGGGGGFGCRKEEEQGCGEWQRAGRPPGSGLAAGKETDGDPDWLAAR